MDKAGITDVFYCEQLQKMLEEEEWCMKKCGRLKILVAVLGALFLGGICKLGIFFSVMLGISLFSFWFPESCQDYKRERIVGTFSRGLYLFRADGGSVSEKTEGSTSLY